MAFLCDLDCDALISLQSLLLEMDNPLKQVMRVCLCFDNLFTAAIWIIPEKHCRIARIRESTAVLGDATK